MAELENLNKLKLYSLYELHQNNILLEDEEITNCQVNYYINSYQRGYRWDDKQIILLLKDLWEFHQKSEQRKLMHEEYYCLQPIVVKSIVKDDEIQQWEVIDGQQRLTTLKILIKYLSSQLNYNLKDWYGISDYKVGYETRPKSSIFLETITNSNNNSEKDDNIDFHYMSAAFNTIENWFVDNSIKTKKEKQKFLDFLLDKNNLNPVKVIWYEVKDSTDSYDLFTRLNIGKIKLTNSELIKALFLKSSDNKNPSDKKDLNEIAYDWNTLEYKLQNDEFWYFIYNGKDGKKFPNRIEYIFDLFCQKNDESEDLFSFFEMERKLGMSDSSRLEVWQEFKLFFNKIEGWFIDREFYHFIGYLIAIDVPFKMIVEQSNSAKNEFLIWLKKEVKEKQLKLNKGQLQELQYGKKETFKVLLLFNILTVLQGKKSNYRFPFNLFKTQKWDIEHIDSKSEKTIETKKEWGLWIADMVEFFTGKNIAETNEEQFKFSLNVDEETVKLNLEKLINAYYSKEFNTNELNNVFKSFQKYFGEDKSILDKDSIYNLALLDQNTNRSYGNAFFRIKRRRIQDNGMYGIFTPVCTTNVFMKIYSKKLDKPNYWSEADAQNYLEAIITVLNPFLLES